MARAFNRATHYFIPNPGNDHKPKILEPQTVKFVCLIALVAELAFLLSATYIIPRSTLFGIVVANTLVDETNAQRVDNGLPALTVNPLLQTAAQEKANDMAKNNYFAHTSPSGLTPWYWFEQVGYSFDYAGENLAVNFSNSQDVTNAWMNSPEHRANILSPDFTQIGMATAQGTFEGQSSTYVVELFGTPAPTPIAPFVNTASAATIPVATNPSTASAPTATPSTSPRQITPTVSGTKTASTKPASKPASKTTSTPTLVVVASATVDNSSSEQLFVAVQGAQATAGAATSGATTTPISPAENNVSANTDMPAPQSNPIQSMAANPTEVANNFFLALITLFAVALGLNIFIKIRIQHPTLIMSGAVVIAVAAICIVLNQNLALLHAAIL